MTQFRPARSRTCQVAIAGLVVLAAGLVVSPSSALTRPAAPRPVASARPAVPTPPEDPASMKPGPKPQRAWLSGVRLTSKQGVAFTLPFPAKVAPQLTLLGNSGKGFVVLRRAKLDAYHTRTDVFTVKKQGATATKHLFFTHTVNPTTNADHVRLSHDGSRILLETTDRGYADVVTVIGVDGHRVAKRSFDSTYVLDFSGPRVVLSDYATPGIVDWTIGSAPVRNPTAPASSADIAHDVVFLGPDYSHAGPTVLSSPGATAWTGNDDTWLVSPSGTRVLGVSYNKVRVHRMTDGSVVSAVHLGLPGNLVAWETATAYLAVAHGHSGYAVVRCQAATGVCRRTTPVMPKPISMSVS